jgi:hypothetical protein
MRITKSINAFAIFFRLCGFATLVFFLFLPPLASAQCMLDNALGFQNISPEPGNPFQAEYSVKITSPTRTDRDVRGSVPRFVARDSQGRVRVEHSKGNYQMLGAAGASNTPTTQERIVTFICDPATRTAIRLDSLQKTATIQALPDVPTPSGPESGSRSFCARFFESRTRYHDGETTDLGRHLVAGLDAHGIRFLSTLRLTPDSMPPATYTDTWCSDELAAVVDLVVVSGHGEHRREALLEKVTRKEPDPAIFRIPTDYARLQRETPAQGGSNSAANSGVTPRPPDRR